MHDVMISDIKTLSIIEASKIPLGNKLHDNGPYESTFSYFYPIDVMLKGCGSHRDIKEECYSLQMMLH